MKIKEKGDRFYMNCFAEIMIFLCERETRIASFLDSRGLHAQR